MESTNFEPLSAEFGPDVTNFGAASHDLGQGMFGVDQIVTDFGGSLAPLRLLYDSSGNDGRRRDDDS